MATAEEKATERAVTLKEFWSERLAVADERLKKLEENPICNRLAITEQLERIAQLEADVLTAIRGY